MNQMSPRTAALSPGNLARFHTRTRPQESRVLPARHLSELEQAIQDCISEPGGRLLISVSPRHGKTTLLEYTIADYLGHNPDRRVLFATHSHGLASEVGERTRNVLQEIGEEVYGVEIDPGSAAKDQWKIKGRRGGAMFDGWGAGFIGFGGDILVVDDPYANINDATNSEFTDKLVNWFKAIFLGRAEPGASVIVCSARWGEEDFIGQLMDMGGWKQVSLPCIREGKPLWPERWTLEQLESQMKAIGSRWWNAQWLCDPQPEGGRLFDPLWIERIPAGTYEQLVSERVRAWDLASSLSKGADFTAGARVASVTTPEGTGFVIEDVVRKKVSPADQEQLIITTAKSDGPEVRISIPVDPGSAGRAWFDHLRHRLYEFDVIESRPTTAKQTRWTPLLAAYERRDVGHVTGPWNKEVEDELKSLPGKHDDIADALSDAVNILSSHSHVAQPRITFV